jgi:RNA polymerase sigma-70 factor (ECF subfamily)
MPAGDNDSERFKALYVAHSREVFAYALRRLRNPDTAADVMAEVFTVAWRKLNAVPNDDSAKLWLFGVARNVVRNQERGIRRRTNLAARLATNFSGIDYEPDPAPEPALMELVRESHSITVSLFGPPPVEARRPAPTRALAQAPGLHC